MSELIYYFDILGLTLSVLICAGVSYYIYQQNRASPGNRVFSVLIAFIGLWTFFYLLKLVNPITEWGLFFRRLPILGGALASAGAFYFSLIFPEEKDLSLLQKILIFVPALIFGYLSIFTDMTIKAYDPSQAAYIYLGRTTLGWLYRIYTVYSSACVFGAATILFYKFLRSFGAMRTKLSFVLFSVIIGAVSSQIFTLYLPSLGIEYFYSMGPIPNAFAVIIIAYAMVRYRLFTITPAIAGEEILHSLGVPFLVCDLAGGKARKYGNLSEGNGEVNKIVTMVVEKGIFTGYKTTIDYKPMTASAQIIPGGGWVIVVFHDETEIEKAAGEEGVMLLELNARLARDRSMRETLSRFASASSPEEINKSLADNQEIAADAANLINKMAQKARQRMELLRELSESRKSLGARLAEIEQINKDGVQRELEMIKLKKEILSLKEGKAS